ncbi:MAG: relaxase MobL [Roseburia sp.]|nr:relaxase MobL [Roseburia sp.]
MTGGKNVFDYMTTEGKRAGKKLTALEYLQKNTGVFNDKGMIPQEQVDEMKARLKENKGHIWHGFISLNEEQSPKIDTPEKCIQLVKQTFPQFFDEAHLNRKNIDLMCALHLDRPHHLHIHFVFWEKEPIIPSKFDRNKKLFRAKGKVQGSAIDNMFVRLGLYLDDDKSRLYQSRDAAIKKLRGMTNAKVAMSCSEEIKSEILALAKELPKNGRLSYGSKDMEPYRERVDNIVKLLLNADGKARRANRKFYQALEERREQVLNICGEDYALTEGMKPSEIAKREMDKYHHKINPDNIKIIERIEEDYKRRQGNLVLGLAKFIKPELFERKPNRKYKSNDNFLKRRLNICRRNVDRACKKFFKSFGADGELIERDFSRRLQEIEEEIERERKKKNGSGSGSGETK